MKRNISMKYGMEILLMVHTLMLMVKRKEYISSPL